MNILKKALAWREERKRPRCAAVIAAAGSSSRMDGVDKLLADLGGKPLLLRTLQTFQSCGCIDEIVVATREDLIPLVRKLCQQNALDKVCAVVEGGKTRSGSVLAALDHVSSRARLAAVHDGARPLVTEELITRTVREAARTGAAAPAVPVKDTIKVTENGVIVSTPDRATLSAMQTPQVFDLDLLRGALFQAEQDGVTVTDDCAAVERLGMKIHLTRGSEENIKVTTPVDLIAANAIFKERTS